MTMSEMPIIERRLISWANRRRYRFYPFGRFKFAGSSPRPSLSASTIALIDIYDYFSLLAELKERHKQQWLDYLQSFQDPESSFFIDHKNRRGIKDVDWVEVEAYDTARGLSALKILGKTAVEAGGPDNQGILRKHYGTENGYLQWLEQLDWTNHPWGAATAVQQAVSLLKQLDDGSAHAQKLLNITHGFFGKTQSNTTFLWGGDANTKDELASATYKVLIIYGECGWSLPNRHEIAEWVFGFYRSAKRPSHLCALRNRISLLLEAWLDRSSIPYHLDGPRSFVESASALVKNGRMLPTVRRYEIEIAVEKLNFFLKEFVSRDGGYSFYPEGQSVSHHNGVILGRGRREGDFLGASNAAFCHASLRVLVEMVHNCAS